MCELILQKLKAWHEKSELCPRIALISGTGGKAFCAGGDIVSLYKANKDSIIKQEFF